MLTPVCPKSRSGAHRGDAIDDNRDAQSLIQRWLMDQWKGVVISIWAERSKLRGISI
jgi:hypothetical protein